MKNTLLVILSLLVFTYCTQKVTTGLTQADADRGATKYPGLTLAELTQGKSLYESNCGSCHGLKKTTAYSEDAWGKIVPRMVIKTNKKAGKEVIDANAQEILLKYVVTMSSGKQ